MATEENDAPVASILDTQRIDTWNIERTDQDLRRFMDEHAVAFDVGSLEALLD